MTFPPEFDTPVRMEDIKLDTITPWIANKITEILGGMEDEILVSFIVNQLEDPELDARKLQINITGFLGVRKAHQVTAELWRLLISAQESGHGIPQEIIDARKEEMRERELAEVARADEIEEIRRKMVGKMEENELRHSGCDERRVKREASDEDGADRHGTDGPPPSDGSGAVAIGTDRVGATSVIAAGTERAGMAGEVIGVTATVAMTADTDGIGTTTGTAGDATTATTASAVTTV
eukprot:CAMPEP_0119158608 /NCGR_PEP_ID=MMETSP1310-20130426/53348_1 /TAXON_ID=464262 /ORGANISM="Genus nov. species nov., Strain RCC2339" /LENGTH=236 /DNA_ID=CAMNT_0007151233 /DNA_START=196 /DNA_END=903 /DNA_ORIENTATION=+